MRRWEPNFKALGASFAFAAIWVRLQELPIEYYETGQRATTKDRLP